MAYVRAGLAACALAVTVALAGCGGTGGQAKADANGAAWAACDVMSLSGPVVAGQDGTNLLQDVRAATGPTINKTGDKTVWAQLGTLSTDLTATGGQVTTLVATDFYQALGVCQPLLDANPVSSTTAG